MQNENNRPEMPKEKVKNPVACMGYCPLLFFVPFIVKNECDEDENRTAALQGFWLLLVFVAIAIISSILKVFLYGQALQLANIIFSVINIALGAVTVLAMVRGYNRKKTVLPVLGHIDLFSYMFS